MEIEEDDEDAPKVNLFQGCCPSLHAIDISGLVVPWNSRIFQNLRSISIDNVWQHPPTVEEVIQMVGSSPGLKHFKLYLGRLPPGPLPQDIPPAVEVPHLKGLTVSYVGFVFTQHIISRIRAPTLNTLIVRPVVYMEDDYHISTFFSLALSHFNPLSAPESRTLTACTYQLTGTTEVSGS